MTARLDDIYKRDTDHSEDAPASPIDGRIILAGLTADDLDALTEHFVRRALANNYRHAGSRRRRNIRTTFFRITSGHRNGGRA